MGVNIARLVSRKDIKFEELTNKKIAIDTYVMLYQFLRTMPEFTNSKGEITTHLLGLFNRTTHLLKYRIKPCFVFDGPWPEVKKHKRFTNPSGPRITTTISRAMVDNTKEMLQALGLPVIQAPSEAEAQAAYLAQKKDVWAVASQDYDTLVFGSPRLIQNITIARTKKIAKGYMYISPYLIELKSLLRQLKINQDQLIALAMLVGTDFNPGVKGIGQQKALKLVKEYGSNLKKLFDSVDWDFEHSWEDVFWLIKTMPVTKKYKLRWKRIDEKKIKKILVEEHDFKEERVESALAKIK